MPFSKYISFSSLVMTLGISLGAFATELPEPKSEPPLSDQQALSYAIGVVFGKRLQQEAGSLDMTLFEQGLEDSYHNRTLKLTDSEIKLAFERYREAQAAAQNREQQAFEQRAEENLKLGQAFLSENAQKTDVKTLMPGIQYKVIKAGKGRFPQTDDKVTVSYKGYLLDGQLFDRSGTPVVFRVDQGPPSWIDVLPKMREGSVWIVWVSPERGFGSGGAGPVGPNEVLEYHIELSAVQPTAQ